MSKFLVVILIFSMVIGGAAFAEEVPQLPLAENAEAAGETPLAEEAETETSNNDVVETEAEPEIAEEAQEAAPAETEAEQPSTEISETAAEEPAPIEKAPISLMSIAFGTYGTCPWDISDSGVLTIKAGTLPETSNNNARPWKDYNAQITSVVVKPDVIAASNSAFLFSGLSKATSIDLSGLDTSNTTNMNNMFSHCKALTSLEISNLNTDKVTDIDFMFASCTSLTSLDVSKIDTSRLKTLISVFNNCANLTELTGLENWDVSQVYDMNSLFRQNIIKDLSGIEAWNTVALKDLNSTFYRAKGITSLTCLLGMCQELQTCTLPFPNQH